MSSIRGSRVLGTCPNPDTPPPKGRGTTHVYHETYAEGRLLTELYFFFSFSLLLVFSSQHWDHVGGRG